ncbi:MAG: GNAT family N-acetyltransferase [Actinomycetes bacterium]
MPILRTDRLILRMWTVHDLDELAEIFADPSVWWFPFQRGLDRDETEVFLHRRMAEWDAQGWGQWAVERDGRLIGYAGFALPTFLPELMPVPEVGWRLHPSAWGYGLATEAGQAALAYGFDDLGFAEVISTYQPENAASGRVMERLGMTLDRETVHPKSGSPVRVYRLSAEAWHRNCNER